MFGFPLLAAFTLFASAGTLEWWPGRYCLRAVGFSWLSTVLFLAVMHPGLLRLRTRKASNAAPWDPPLLRVLRVAILLLLAVAGLQSRGAESAVTWEVFAFGLGLLVTGTSLLWVCFHCNPFFETEVRHQSDRQQTVAQSGPYALVRHPGYLALILLLGSLPLMLQSTVAAGPWLLCVYILVTRLRREEAYLDEHLSGYPEYRERVRFRLLPYIW